MCLLSHQASFEESFFLSHQASFEGWFLISSGFLWGDVSVWPPGQSLLGGTPVMRALLLQSYQGEATWHRLPTQAQLWEKSGGDGSL